MDPVSRMDIFDELPALTINQIAQAHCALVRTRNRLVASFYSIPQEILAEIFTLVVNDRSGHRVRNVSMRSTVNAYYWRLYSLIAVCSVWRDAALSHGALWSLTPITGPGFRWPSLQVTELSLDRARGRYLYLAGHFQTKITSAHISILRNHLDRFCTINLVADSHQSMRQALSPLFDRPLSSLIELSLHRIPTNTNRLPEPNDFLSYADQTKPGPINFLSRNFESLAVLRLQNVHIDWEFFAFPKLTQLRVETIEFRSNPEFKKFMIALSRAPMLQSLEIIDLSIEPLSEEDFPDTIGPITVSFSALQQLYIGSLYMNETRLLFQSIIPGAYILSLNLSRRCIFFDSEGMEEEAAFEELLVLLRGVKVGVLLIDGDDYFDTWVTPEDLHRLLQHLPSITTLKIHCWCFAEDYWNALTAPPQPDLAKASEFPRLRSFQITMSLLSPLRSEATIDNFLAGHTIQHFILGATEISPDDLPPYLIQIDLCTPISNCEQSIIARQFKSKVSDFILVRPVYVPEEFLSCHESWRLW